MSLKSLYDHCIESSLPFGHIAYGIVLMFNFIYVFLFLPKKARSHFFSKTDVSLSCWRKGLLPWHKAARVSQDA